MRRCLAFGAMEGVASSIVLLAAVSTFPTCTIHWALRFTTAALAGLSMVFGARNWFQESTQLRCFEYERRRELWGMRNFAEGERTEMVELFMGGGVSEPDARKAIDLLSRPQYEQFFVDLMMVKELNMEIPDRTHSPTALGGATTAAAFGAGMIPVIWYLVAVSLAFTPPSVDTTAVLSVGCASLLWAFAVLTLLRVDLFPASSQKSIVGVYGGVLGICGLAVGV